MVTMSDASGAEPFSLECSSPIIILEVSVQIESLGFVQKFNVVVVAVEEEELEWLDCGRVNEGHMLPHKRMGLQLKLGTDLGVSFFRGTSLFCFVLGSSSSSCGV